MVCAGHSGAHLDQRNAYTTHNIQHPYCCVHIIFPQNVLNETWEMNMKKKTREGDEEQIKFM
jgi:hypothetical protein